MPRAPRARPVRALGGSALVACPVCGRSVAVVVADAHALAGDGARKGERARRASARERRDVVEDYRGRRAHTGARATGYVPTNELAGGWIERASALPTVPRVGGGGDAFARLRDGARLAAKVKMSGHFLIENFIDEEEERRIVEFLDGDVTRPWKDSSFNGAHEGKKYGVEANLLKRTVGPAVAPIPKILRELVIAKFATAHETLKRFTPNECNAISYRKDLGSTLTPHCDDRQLSSDILVNLSLLGNCTMTYIHEKYPEKKVDVFLPRRSLQIQSGSTRYDYMHSISNENLHDPRRVSVTFRESGVLVKKLDS